MTRLFWAAILLVALAVPAFAQEDIPSAANSTVTWYQPLASGGFWVCPTGDASAIDVTVMSQFKLPMANVLVTAAIADPRVIVITPIQGITDVEGNVRLTIWAGTDATASTDAINTNVTVTCLGVTLYSQSLYCHSPEVHGANTVGALDFSIFALDFLKSKAIPPGYRSDYNEDGTVNSLDYSKFCLHYGHSFP